MQIRVAGLEDIESYVKLLKEVREGMEHKEWFYIDSDEELRQTMASGCMKMWFAEEDGHLAGVFNLLYPGLESFNLGYDLQLSREELERVVEMDVVAVHPDFRGRGIQRMMMDVAYQEIVQTPGRILLCTVHPENKFSLNNCLKFGYRIEKRIPKYGSERYVLRMDLD